MRDGRLDALEDVIKAVKIVLLVAREALALETSGGFDSLCWFQTGHCDYHGVERERRIAGKGVDRQRQR